jgi:hypothetical protein
MSLRRKYAAYWMNVEGSRRHWEFKNPGQTLYLRLEDRRVLKLIERLEKQILRSKSLATGTKDPRILAS